jgi:hypothetical protein
MCSENDEIITPEYFKKRFGDSYIYLGNATMSCDENGELDVSGTIADATKADLEFFLKRLVNYDKDDYMIKRYSSDDQGNMDVDEEGKYVNLEELVQSLEGIIQTSPTEELRVKDIQRILGYELFK